MSPEPDAAAPGHAGTGVGPFADLDVAGFGEALARAAAATAVAPQVAAGAAVRLAFDLARIPAAAAAAAFGGPARPPLPPDPHDRRFADPTWTTNPAFFALRQAYLAAGRFGRDVVGGARLDADVARKAALATDLLLDALAPTNCAATNPAVLTRAFETGGASLLRGARTFVDDVAHRGGRPRQVDADGFRLGENLAATPAKVVYRNDLMELLQYGPQTEQVHAVPLLVSPPWINKYYVLDLAPGRSFVEWAVRHGHTVFAISYRNPTAEMAATTMEDYLVDGPRTALDVVCDITGAATVDMVGLCLGGALTAITAAHLAAAGDDRIGTLTLVNTMIDYSEPGVLGAFTDRRAVDRLEHRMRREGVLPATAMSATFDVLRANDLIFSYVVSNWLLGEPPPAFDILSWNADATRMPAAMHAFYLRSFYVENRLAVGTLELGGRRIDLGAVRVPVYVAGAVNDHIVPWTAAHATTRLVGGPVRFVLGRGGHIAGIVSPPGPKAWYLATGSPEDPDDRRDAAAEPDAGTDTDAGDAARRWRAGAERRAGSWWEDWAPWSARHAGPLRTPPPTGSPAHPVLGDGPGIYVLD